MLDNHLDTEAEQEITEQEPEIDEPIQDEQEPVIPEEYAETIEALLTIYPEFKPVLQTQEQIDSFIAIIDQVRCLYPEFMDLKKCGATAK